MEGCREGWRDGERKGWGGRSDGGCREGWRGRGVQRGREDRKKIEKAGNLTVFKDLLEPNTAYCRPQ